VIVALEPVVCPLARRKRGRGLGARKRRMREARLARTQATLIDLMRARFE